MRVAAARVTPAADLPAALAAASGLAARAAAAGAELLLLPQRFAGEAGGPSDGPAAAGMSEIAAAAGVAVAYGYVERCTGQGYDAVQVVDAGGRGIANYRRAHLDGSREDGRFARGHWLSAMPLGRRRLGILCGYDLAFPEAARSLRLVGCDLLLVAGGASPLPAAAGVLLAARAAENGCCVAFASADPGEPAAVLGPGGAPLGRPLADEPALVLAELPPAAPADPRGPALLRDRRPRLYRRLTAPDGADAEEPA